MAEIYSVERIGALLTPHTPQSDGLAWGDALHTGWMQRGAGEIRAEADVGWVPRDELIEVAFAHDDEGPVLRWVPQSDRSPARAAGYSALSHTHYEAPPTAHGWVIVKSDGTMVVQDPKKIEEELRPPFDVACYGNQLPSAFNNGGHSKFSWEEAKRLGSRNQVCGEIRNAKDLERVPKNIPLRAIYVEDGGQGHIRWADSSKMHLVFEGANHDYLYCAGDRVVPSREGYMRVYDDGTIVMGSS